MGGTTIDVICFDKTGAPWDQLFDLAYAISESPSATSFGAYAWADQATSTSVYTADTKYQYNGFGTGNLTAQLSAPMTGAGTYTITIPGTISYKTSTVLVTAYCQRHARPSQCLVPVHDCPNTFPASDCANIRASTSICLRRVLSLACGSAQSFIIKWQNEPKFNFKKSHICFSRKPCRFRDPVALAFVWRMPDARSVRASATRGGRESTQCLVPVHHSTRQ